MTDAERLDWLEFDTDRLEDVRGRMNNEGGTIRDAIDWLECAHREFYDRRTAERVAAEDQQR